MFRNLSLQSRLIAAFLVMGFLVLTVALVGWLGVNELSQHIQTLGNNSLPSVIGLWKINEGQTQIESSERFLMVPNLTEETRQENLTRINAAWQQINSGFEQYSATSQTEKEKQLYQQFLQDWQAWQQEHERYMALEAEFDRQGIRNPWARQLQLGDGSPNLAANQAVERSLSLYAQLAQLQAQEANIFQRATNSLLEVINENEAVARRTQVLANGAIERTSFWQFFGLIVGPLAAIALGVSLSLAIAKPLDRALRAIINQIVSSSTEIAAAVRQQESIAAQQASFVNQTATAIDELGATSRLATEQAEAAAKSADRALQQAEQGNQVVNSTLGTMNALNLKITTLGEQIARLNEQTSLIGTISSVVGELANQTNMLALNAAVEAVRAGAAGKGFGVVANEIRRLADQSKRSAQNITDLVSQIQMAVNSTVKIRDEATQTIGSTKQQVESMTAAFGVVTEAIEQVAFSSQQISQSSQQQAIAMQQAIEAMNHINTGARQTAVGLSQTQVGTQQLNEAALRLRNLV